LAIPRISSSSAAIRRGVKPRLITLRSFVCAGGSMPMIENRPGGTWPRFSSTGPSEELCVSQSSVAFQTSSKRNSA
jgi:hypothetical protein